VITILGNEGIEIRNMYVLISLLIYLYTVDSQTAATTSSDTLLNSIRNFEVTAGTNISYEPKGYDDDDSHGIIKYDANTSLVTRTQNYTMAEIEAYSSKYLNFFCFGDWGKGGINGDIRYQNGGRVTKRSSDEVHTESKDSGENNGKTKVSYTYQMAMAEAMGTYAESVVAPSAIFVLGDNFYTDGVQSAYDEMWETHWSKVYLDTSDKLKVPWYSAFGNHVHIQAHTLLFHLSAY